MRIFPVSFQSSFAPLFPPIIPCANHNLNVAVGSTVAVAVNYILVKLGIINPPAATITTLVILLGSFGVSIRHAQCAYVDDAMTIRMRGFVALIPLVRVYVRDGCFNYAPSSCCTVKALLDIYIETRP